MPLISINQTIQDQIKNKFELIQTTNIDSISKLKNAAYITSAYCASINSLNKYGAYMQMLEADKVVPSIKKKAKNLEVYLLSIAEQAIKDFNQGIFNPPNLKLIKPQGFQKKFN